MRILTESPGQPEIVALIAELDAYQDTLYPPESRHLLTLAALEQPNVIFMAARSAGGSAIGCGAVVVGPDYGEVKRMYVHPQSRGSGVARQLLEHLESAARARGCATLRLETGPYQPAAIALYERAGYKRRGPFGAYTDDPLSVFMEKTL
jgi:putative acetyltransferase